MKNLIYKMILGIGVDILHLPRIKALLTRKPTSLLRFSKRILSNGELIEFNNTFKKINLEQVTDNNVVKFLAVRWTLKEATYKALFPYYRLKWKDVSINQVGGKPQLIVHGVKPKGIDNIKIYSSVSHDGEYVISQVLIESNVLRHLNK